MDGVVPGTYKLGADSEVQTITFRRSTSPVGGLGAKIDLTSITSNNVANCNDNTYQDVVVKDATNADTQARVDVTIATNQVTDIVVKTAGSGMAVGDTVTVKTSDDANCSNDFDVQLQQNTMTLNLGPNSVADVVIGDGHAAFKTALESMENVDRVEVERNGDGVSPSTHMVTHTQLTSGGVTTPKVFPRLLSIP
jgi:hypothetical protein